MTIPRHFFDQAERLKERRALLYKRDDKWLEISWSEFAKRVRALASCLISKGIKKGDRVALLSENRPEWAISDLAILSAGGITVPVYFTNSSHQVDFILGDSGSKAVIVSTEKQLGKILEAKSRSAIDEIILLDEPEGTLPEGVSTLSGILDGFYGRGEALPEKAAEGIAEDDIASILYTSGTTGKPKGVVLTHRNFLSNARACTAAVDVSEADIFLSFLPLSHALERTVGYYVPVIAGSTIAYAESIDRIPQNILEVRPTIIIGVPRFFEKTYTAILEAAEGGAALKRAIFNRAVDTGKECSRLRRSGEEAPPSLRLKERAAKMLVYGKIRKRLGGRLRFFVSGGAPLARDIADFFDAVEITILEGYGLTETSPVITSNTIRERKPGTVGRPLHGIEVKTAPDGEIMARGENIMKGYYKRDDLTKEVIRDGWLYTGDIGEIDEEGYLTITDRKKDIIVTSGGKNVAPQNIETTLMADPLISQAMVCGEGRNYLTALIVPERGNLKKMARSKNIPFSSVEELLTKEEILQLYMGRIEDRLKDFARFEKIRRFALLPEELSIERGEITPTLKIRRKVVTEKYRSVIDGMYEET